MASLLVWLQKRNILCLFLSRISTELTASLLIKKRACLSKLSRSSTTRPRTWTIATWHACVSSFVRTFTAFAAEISRRPRLIRRFTAHFIHLLSSASIFNIYCLYIVLVHLLEWILHFRDDRFALLVSCIWFCRFTSLFCCDFTLEIQIFSLYQVALLSILSIWMSLSCNWFWLLCICLLFWSVGKLIHCSCEDI